MALSLFRISREREREKKNGEEESEKKQHAWRKAERERESILLKQNYLQYKTPVNLYTKNPKKEI